jgi:tetratricopeptide (TPR) repeat protein
MGAASFGRSALFLRMRFGVVDRLDLAPLLRVGMIAALGILPAAVAAQQSPSPADLPAAYRGTDIDKALKSHNWPQAEALLVAAIERTPDSPELLTVLGSVFLVERKPLNAAIAIKKAEKIAPLDPGTRFTLALAYIAMHHGDWARPELESLAAADASNMTVQYWLGRIDYDDGKYDAAVGRFTKVIEADPTAVRAHDNLGLCYEALNQPDAAVEHYRKAIALNRAATTKSGWPSLNLGILLRTRGELAEAETLVREAVRDEPALPQAHYQLGALLENQEHLDQAVHELKRATELQADYAPPYYALARIYRRQGHGTEADQALATFRRLHDAARPVPAP